MMTWKKHFGGSRGLTEKNLPTPSSPISAVRIMGQQPFLALPTPEAIQSQCALSTADHDQVPTSRSSQPHLGGGPGYRHNHKQMLALTHI